MNVDVQTPPSSQQAPAAAPPAPLARRLLRRIFRSAITTAIVLAGLWATLALMLADLDDKSPRIVWAILYAVVFVVLVLVKSRRIARVGAVLMILLVATWYFSIFPSNDRAWAPQCARLATAAIDGDLVTLLHYRTVGPAGPDGVFEERYVDRTFDLRNISRADLIMSNWA